MCAPLTPVQRLPYKLSVYYVNHNVLGFSVKPSLSVFLVVAMFLALAGALPLAYHTDDIAPILTGALYFHCFASHGCHREPDSPTNMRCSLHLWRARASVTTVALQPRKIKYVPRTRSQTRFFSGIG